MQRRWCMPLLALAVVLAVAGPPSAPSRPLECTSSTCSVITSSCSIPPAGAPAADHARRPRRHGLSLVRLVPRWSLPAPRARPSAYPGHGSAAARPGRDGAAHPGLSRHHRGVPAGHGRPMPISSLTWCRPPRRPRYLAPSITCRASIHAGAAPRCGRLASPSVAVGGRPIPSAQLEWAETGFGSLAITFSWLRRTTSPSTPTVCASGRCR